MRTEIKSQFNLQAHLKAAQANNTAKVFNRACKA
jgi:hypothetical protein